MQEEKIEFQNNKTSKNHGVEEESMQNFKIIKVINIALLQMSQLHIDAMTEWLKILAFNKKIFETMQNSSYPMRKSILQGSSLTSIITRTSNYMKTCNWTLRVIKNAVAATQKLHTSFKVRLVQAVCEVRHSYLDYLSTILSEPSNLCKHKFCTSR